MDNVRGENTLFSAMISFFLYVGTVLVLLVFLFRRYALRKKVKAFRYPPGPSPFPLVGNLFSLPIKTPWIFHTRNRAKYGEHIQEKQLQ